MTMARAVPALGFVAVFAALLAGCGFHLRGQQQLPFDSLYVPGAGPLAVELRRNLAAAAKDTRLVDNAKDAQAILGFTNEIREKIILSFDTSGRVREYQLRYIVGFRLIDAKGQVYIPTSQIRLTRDISFSDALVLSKEAEEAQLYRDMQSDMVQLLLRRIAAAKTAKPDVD
jgi:LPS-assembly lipoprotein